MSRERGLGVRSTRNWGAEAVDRTCGSQDGFGLVDQSQPTLPYLSHPGYTPTMASQVMAETQAPIRRELVPRIHTAFDGIPFYDEELQVAQNDAHRIMAFDFGTIFGAIAQEARLGFLADQPIWYLEPDTNVQKAFYGDCVLSGAVDSLRITATSLLLVLEVVSTQERRKELKDTVFQRALNEYNKVPEFVMVFPELDDARALTVCRLVAGAYQEHVVTCGGSMVSTSVPGLELRVRPRATWERGRKIDIYYRGELRLPLDQERLRAEREKASAKREKASAKRERDRADEEKARADEEKARADEEKARANRLAEMLRALGIDPNCS